MDADKIDIQVGNIAVRSVGLNLAELDLHGGEGFWEEIARFASTSRLEGHLDQLMEGRSAPRIWTFMEAPGGGSAAAAAALGAARILGDRGQSVVLVDADEQEPRISRWLGRVEQEGWIDMVRFGASLHMASDSLPSSARRGSVLGVGSFSPTGVTPEEVAELIARLKHHADDIVIVVPAKIRSLPWLESAHFRILGWDLLSRSLGDTDKIVRALERMGTLPNAVLGFGVEEYQAIQGHLTEDSPPDPPVKVEEKQEPLAPVPPPPEEPAATVPADEPIPPAPAEAKGEPRVAPGIELGAFNDQQQRRPRRRSSGIFVFVALAAVACLVFLGKFFLDQRADRSPVVASGERTSMTADDIPVSIDEPMIETPATFDSSLVMDESTRGDADLDRETAARPDSSDHGAVTPPDQTGGEDIETDHAVVVDDVPVVPETTVDEEPAPTDQPTAPIEPSFDPTPYRQPAGEAGWALWLYSLASRTEADREVRELERRGLSAVVRIVDVEGRGRWHRVYTGSFTSRGEARRAAPALLARLRHDWAVPTAF